MKKEKRKKNREKEKPLNEGNGKLIFNCFFFDSGIVDV